MPIDVPLKLRDQRGELRPLGGGVQVPRRVQIQKQLGDEMGQKPQKDLLAAAQSVGIAPTEHILGQRVARQAHHLQVLGDQLHPLHAVGLGVKQDVVPLVACPPLDAYEMVAHGADQNEISPFQLVFAVLNDVAD